MKRFIIYSLSLVLTIFGCKKYNSTKDNGSGRVAYYASANTSIPLIKIESARKPASISSLPPIKWVSATIFVNEISFEGISTQQVNTTELVETNLDLFASDNNIGMIQLPSGEFKNSKVTLHLKKGKDSKASFIIKAIYTNSKGNDVPFQVANSDEFNVKLEVGNLKVNSLKKYKAVFSYKLDKIFDGISTADLENIKDRYSDEGVYISSSVNVNLYEKIKQNWQTLASAEFIEE